MDSQLTNIHLHKVHKLITHFSVRKPIISFISPVVSNEPLFVFCCQILCLLECDKYHSMILLLFVHRQITKSAI